MKIKIVSITPLHIGSGNRYPTFTIKEKERLEEFSVLQKFVEENKFLKKIESGEMKIDELKNMITIERLKEFVNTHNGFKVLYSLDEVDANIYSYGEVEEHIKHLTTPYIPGSSLKGALITSLLFAKLNKLPQRDCERVIRELEEGERKREVSKVIGEIEKRWIDDLKVSDCMLKSFKLKVGFVIVSKRIKIPVEVIDDFEGYFEVESEKVRKEEIFESISLFSKKYLQLLLSDQFHELILGNKEHIKRMKLDHILVLGKFTNLLSKTIQILIKERGIKSSFYVKWPHLLRVFSLNNTHTPIGFVRIE